MNTTGKPELLPDVSESRFNQERLLTAKEVAAVLNVSQKRVYELGIPDVKLSRRCRRWRPSTVQQWIRDREAA